VDTFVEGRATVTHDNNFARNTALVHRALNWRVTDTVADAWPSISSRTILPSRTPRRSAYNAYARDTFGSPIDVFTPVTWNDSDNSDTDAVVTELLTDMPDYRRRRTLDGSENQAAQSSSTAPDQVQVVM
jgi:hypothetical protein